ncbi:MAG: S-methyl-5-thioribose-1-phosphate isomerase, partial [Actinobacteria bacterium]|nr:S-methyl-5-thioribose-1-phosphate isomerase [Actinomycetota bacterium]
LNRMEKVLDESHNHDIEVIKKRLLDEAKKIEDEDLKINYMIGESGFGIFSASSGLKILTHCNAGALATSGYGTALAVIRSLHRRKKVKEVIVDETRPFLQGARLTAWELYQEKIPFYVITDNMSGYFMSKGEVDAVIVGADRIAANGDSANKIGTLSLSIIAGFFNIPFYVAAPISTIDFDTKSGDMIPIEERNESEIREISGKTVIPGYMPVRNPAFDVTPYGNITAIITEEGVIRPPFHKNMDRILKVNKVNLKK